MTLATSMEVVGRADDDDLKDVLMDDEDFMYR
jgi:hypothetical protein